MISGESKKKAVDGKRLTFQLEDADDLDGGDGQFQVLDVALERPAVVLCRRSVAQRRRRVIAVVRNLPFQRWTRVSVCLLDQLIESESA